MKKGIGVGIEDFKKIIEEDCYYFDKTNYIEELLKDRTEIKLFTRPRRFGKTLNMTTLKYFFDVKNAEENRKLFKDLYIEKSDEKLSKFDGIWQLMVHNGYLKISEKISNDEYMIKIPNYEIQTFFKKGFIDKFLVSGKKRKHLKVRM